MKNFIGLAALFLILTINCSAQTETLGNKLTLTETTSISAINAEPESFVGKTVLVEGEVLEVCKMAGCWMELKGDKEGEKIKVKVKDGDIVFPVEAVGKTAKVEGTVYRIDLTQQEAIDYYKHIADENGKEFDETSVTGPVTIYQIKGSGAEINKE